MKLNLNYLSKELKLNTSKVEMNSYSSTSLGGCDHTNINALDLIKTPQLSVINLAKKKKIYFTWDIWNYEIIWKINILTFIVSITYQIILFSCVWCGI
jgi:hypothetical protein